MRRYAALEETATLAVGHFEADVRDGRYPSSEETYHMTDQMADVFELSNGRSDVAEVTVSPPV